LKRKCVSHLAPQARHLCRTRTKKIFQLRQERHLPRPFPEYAAPDGAGGFVGSGFYKDSAPDGAVLQTRLNLLHSHLTPLPCEFIFSGVKPALRKTKKHPISKGVGVRKGHGLRSDDLVDALRGIQRGLDEMKAGKGEPARKVLDRIRAKHKIPFPQS
jgi:hypothetical protein